MSWLVTAYHHLGVPDPSELLRQIERRYGFALPAEYREMQERGWFGPITAEEGQDVYAHPRLHAYLWLNEMEWMPLAQIVNFELPSYCKPPVVLIPFARSGGGDYWCWSPHHATRGVVPVVSCPHDSCMGEVYARDFVSSLYRQILDFAHAGFDQAAVARRHLGRWLDDLGPYFKPTWRQTVASLREGPIKSWKIGKFKARGLLLPEEHAAIVKRDLVFPKLDEQFNWMGI